MWGEIFRERKPMEIYPDKPLGNVLQIAMPRSPRLYAPGRTMHVVARCNNQEFYFTTAGCLNPALAPVSMFGISAGRDSVLSEAVSF